MGRNRGVSIEFATAALDRSLTASSAAPRSAFPSIVLQKSFWGDEQKFLEPLMRFACGDMRDHIVSYQNDHRPSYWRRRALRQQERLSIDFREIFRVVRFSTFATISARSEPRSDPCPE